MVPVYVRSRVHFALVDNRYLAEAFSRFDSSGQTQIKADTRLVIEGCPRSGNSYALAAFLYSNPGVHVASHRHSPTAVRTALKRGLPVIVVIRPPRPTIASGLQYYPDQRPDWAVTLYKRYFTKLLPYADKALLATFDEVTQEFGEVVRRCNSRFGTNFVPYEQTEESEKAIAAQLDQWLLRNFDEAEMAQKSGRPSPARRSPDEVLAELPPALVQEIDDLDKLYNAVLLHR